jgi:RNA recognition motif-containing protein
MKNIFVSNLSFRITNEDLQTAFAEYGEVISAKVIIDNFSGKSRGFGFVEMTNDEEADKAIEELNNAEFDSKVISVAVAKPKSERKPGGHSGGGFNRNSDRREGGGGYNKNGY